MRVLLIGVAVAVGLMILGVLIGAFLSWRFPEDGQW